MNCTSASSAGDSKAPSATICPICYNDTHKSVNLPCDHRFCKSCLNKWQAKTCPLCRRSYTCFHRYGTRFKYLIIKTNELKEKITILLRHKDYDKAIYLLLQNRWFISSKNLYFIVNTDD